MKTNNEMPGHAAKTLADVRAEIAVRRAEIVQLTGIETGLVELYGPGEPATPPPSAAKVTTKPTPKPKPAEPAGEERTGRAPSAETVKIMAAMRTCPEPFTMESLRVATNAPTKSISNCLTNYHAKGWLERVGRGEYKRTGTFPAAA